MRLSSIFSLSLASLSLFLTQCGSLGASDKSLVKTVEISADISIAALSPDRKITATVDRSNLVSGMYAISVWQVDDGRLRYQTPKYGVYHLTFSGDGKLLAASCDDGVRLFRAAEGELFRKLEGIQIFCSAFSSDGQTLASGGADGRVRVWRVKDGSLMKKYDVDKWITSLAFSHDGKFLAASSAANIGFVRPSEASQESNPILVWRLTDDKLMGSLSGHQYGVLTLAFAGNDQELASGGSDGYVRLWRLQDSALLQSFQNDSRSAKNPSSIEQLSLSPDGRVLAAASSNSNILLLRSDAFSSIRVLRGHKSGVLSVVFGEDGASLLSIGKDKTIRLWDVST